MARLILDTSVLVRAERGDAAQVAADDDVAIAAVTVAELEVGVELGRGRHKPARRQFVDDLVAGVEVIPYDLHVARVHARLLAAVRREGKPRGAHDLIIAATAVATGRSVVTADPRGFTGLPGVLIAGPIS